MQFTVRVKSNFSVPHLLAAALFSRRVSAIEKNNLGRPYGAFWEEILSYSIACVFGCIASLESYANELLADAISHFPRIPADIMEKLIELYDQKPILDKYELILMLRKRPRFDKGKKPYQDVEILIKLRNALTHFKPEWDDEQVLHRKLAHRLKGRFPLSPFMGDGDPIFPKRWATSGCTKWAVKSTLAFINGFEELARFEHRFKKFTDRLDVE